MAKQKTQDPRKAEVKPPFPQQTQRHPGHEAKMRPRPDFGEEHKGAIVTFTKGLAGGLITRGIRVNAVAPGPVWTPLIPQSLEKEEVSTFGEDSPMQRPAQPVELAPAFVFLASDESRYVNGEVLGVTGGRFLG